MKTYADPGVFERFVRLDPLLWVDGQHLVDQILGLRCHGVPLRRRVLREKEKED